MFGVNRLIETMNTLGDQAAKGLITQDQADYNFGKAIYDYGSYNAIMGGLLGMGIIAAADITTKVFIKPVTKKLINKIKNKKNSKLKVEEKEQA